MDVFEAKIRGFHAKAVQNIMARTTGFVKPQSRQKAMKPKGDNITTYLRKFQIDRQNLNLAKRILLCESEHDHKFYKREWKKTENFLRVRSNFKRGLCNQQPRLFKFQQIQGKGNCLITIIFTRFQSSPIHFRPQNLYQLKILVKHNPVCPTNSNFNLQTLGNNPMSFYIPSFLRKKRISCKISQIKENQIYDKGKMQINLAHEGQQQVEIVNKSGKVVAVVGILVGKEGKTKTKGNNRSKNKDIQRKNNNSLHEEDGLNEKSDYYENASQQNI